MSDEPRARSTGVHPQNETTLPAKIYQALARTLQCTAAVAGPLITIDNKIISTSFMGGIAIADMTGLVFSTIPMTIYHEDNEIRELDRLVGGAKVRIFFSDNDDIYYADNGHLELPFGRKHHELICHPHEPVLTLQGNPVTGLKPAMLRQHIGKAQDVVLGLFGGQLEQIYTEVGNPLHLNPATAETHRGSSPDLRLVVSQSFKVLGFSPNSFSIQVGMTDGDYYVETSASLGHKMSLRVREKAEEF